MFFPFQSKLNLPVVMKSMPSSVPTGGRVPGKRSLTRAGVPRTGKRKTITRRMARHAYQSVRQAGEFSPGQTVCAQTTAASPTADASPSMIHTWMWNLKMVFMR